MSAPEMITVASSLIESAGYAAEDRKLYVKFHSGPTWVYEEVGPEVYQEFMATPSVGKYFLKEIKGVYPGKKVEEE